MPNAAPRPVAGLHHVTAISGAPQANVDFYTGTLGQRLVKKTVNFDDPGTYHLYYGDATGTPGTILTFFPFASAAPGRDGPGQALAYAYRTPRGAAFDDWAARLEGIADGAMTERFGARVLGLADPHGQRFELIEDDVDGTALAGFHSVTLWVADPGPTARVLIDVFGYAEAGHDASGGEERLRLVAPGAGIASIVDIMRRDSTATARQGAGSIHHVAFRAADDAHQDEIREALLAAGHQATQRIDRQYFNAIYFREPGGILFEVATDPPGFTVDEAPEELGRNLRLPQQHEHLRARIEAHLPPLAVPA